MPSSAAYDQSPPRRPAARLAAAALALTLPGCGSTAELATRQAAEPEAVAAAVCREVRTGEAAGCENVVLTDRASEIAYATCLDYNRRDLRACDRLRRAYEDDIRARLAAQTPRPAPVSAAKRPAPAGPQQGGARQSGPQQGGPSPSAETLYKAANSDADTFQAALLIPEIRKKIEAALGKPLSDAQLHALIDNNRAEAVYWYSHMQQPQPAPATARTPAGG